MLYKQKLTNEIVLGTRLFKTNKRNLSIFMISERFDIIFSVFEANCFQVLGGSVWFSEFERIGVNYG